MSSLSNKSSCELIYLASTFAITLSQGLTCDEVSILATFLTTVGDNLSIIAAQCSNNSENPK